MTRDYSKFTLPSAQIGSAARERSTLETLGWQPFFAQQISVEEMQETPPVRVVEMHRTALRVIGEGVDTEIPFLPDTAVGDWLLLDAALPGRSRLLERKSLLKRRAPGHEKLVQFQLIAANIDTVFIVSSCNADFNVARLERYAALCFEAEITPVIVLTKSDMTADAQEYVTQAAAISDQVAVVTLDARGQEPREKLAPWCGPGRTVAFLGSSGVGKSTLTNALSGGDAVKTGAIREDDAHGRHTTTRRQLHRVPGGCVVMDTPGMRELQMTDVAAGIEAVFADLAALATQCRFRDCQHQSEPGCAVLEAVAAGDVDEARVRRWHKLAAEDAFNAATPLDRRKKDKAFGKMVRKVVKGKVRR